MNKLVFNVEKEEAARKNKRKANYNNKGEKSIKFLIEKKRR
jgi:hypothetical protein